MNCTFCKKQAVQLAPHHLCDICLVHLECCEINDILSGHEESPDDEDDDSMQQCTTEKLECDICLEKVQKAELQQHRELCSARLVFRCKLCSDDFLSKEALWNHLDLHEIEDDKELQYNEVRTTQELLKCELCNDQRGYVEKTYWEHVHEDHDGYFLRCSDCGELFRSKKHKTSHALRNCKEVKGTEATTISVKPQVISLNLPLQVNVLASFGKMYQQTSDHSSNKGDISNTGDKAPFDSKLFFKKELPPHIEVIQKTVVDDEARRDGSKNEQSSSCNKRKMPNENICQHDNIHDETCEDSLKPIENKTQDKTRQEDEQRQSIVDHCPICDKLIRDRDLLSQHVKLSHERIICTDCGTTVPDVVQLEDHKVKKHRLGQSAVTIGDQDNSEVDSIETKQNDESLTSADQSTDDANQKLQCPCCSGIFQGKQQLHIHMGEHVDEIANKRLKLALPPQNESSSIAITDIGVQDGTS
ncbi:zinc finger protein 60-like isoform X2 [Armigeres subalbatus]|uniref:zinc finger protein 60-like isoform X2 n=1 Tax=Armigeres subalbatus TaxID=124917 RepID=UPI002ED38F03